MFNVWVSDPEAVAGAGAGWADGEPPNRPVAIVGGGAPRRRRRRVTSHPLASAFDQLFPKGNILGP